MTREFGSRTTNAHNRSPANLQMVSMLFAKQPKLAVSGLTLIECLVAIAVVAITTAAIGPMILFSVATRVQNQRVEEALRLAQTEINKVRTEIDSGDYRIAIDNIPPTSERCIADTSAPRKFLPSGSNINRVTDARLVDFDGDGDDDYAIQLFRKEKFRKEINSSGEEELVATPKPIMVEIGARVYDSKRAEPSSGKVLDTKAASLTFTSGEGQAGTHPLAVIYRALSPGERADLRDLHDELENTDFDSSVCAS